MRYLKFTMSNGEKLTLPYDLAKVVLESSKQLVALLDDKGEWTGKAINKAFIVSIGEDTETAKLESELARYNQFQLPDVSELGKKEMRDGNAEAIKRIRETLREKLGWH